MQSIPHALRDAHRTQETLCLTFFFVKVWLQHLISRNGGTALSVQTDVLNFRHCIRYVFIIYYFVTLNVTYCRNVSCCKLHYCIFMRLRNVMYYRNTEVPTLNALLPCGGRHEVFIAGHPAFLGWTVIENLAFRYVWFVVLPAVVCIPFVKGAITTSLFEK